MDLRERVSEIHDNVLVQRTAFYLLVMLIAISIVAVGTPCPEIYGTCIEGPDSASVPPIPVPNIVIFVLLGISTWGISTVIDEILPIETPVVRMLSGVLIFALAVLAVVPPLANIVEAVSLLFN